MVKQPMHVREYGEKGDIYEDPNRPPILNDEIRERYHGERIASIRSYAREESGIGVPVGPRFRHGSLRFH